MSRLLSSCTRGAPSVPRDAEVSAGPGRPGDLVLARVKQVGCYPRVENAVGREVLLRPGDEFVGVLGDRQSSTSLYGGVPAGGWQIDAGTDADLLAVGGVIGIAESSPGFLGAPTRLELLGLVRDQAGSTIGLLRQEAADLTVGKRLVLVGGTAAEVGKTTFAAALVHHLHVEYGLRVGVTKLAGTGRLRDLLTLADAGAHCAADFVDAGLATTYGHPTTSVVGAARYLVGHLIGQGAQVVVAELGGDLWAAGIPAILADPALIAAASVLVLVPSDTMASLGVDTWVRQQQIGIPFVHAVPYRNVLAARQRMQDGLGVEPVDAASQTDLRRLCKQQILPALASQLLSTG